MPIQQSSISGSQYYWDVDPCMALTIRWCSLLILVTNPTSRPIGSVSDYTTNSNQFVRLVSASVGSVMLVSGQPRTTIPLQTEKSHVAIINEGQISGPCQSFIRCGGSLLYLYKILQKLGTPQTVVFIKTHRNAEFFAL